MIDWTIVAAVATAVAAVAALVALWFTASTERRAVELQRREQASRVAVWPEGTQYHAEEGETQYHAPFTAIVNNGSDQPIYQVRVELLPVEWTKSSKAVDASGWLTIQPNDTGEAPMPKLEGRMEIVDGLPAQPPMRLYFRDGAGVRWVRYPDGQLHELKRRWWQKDDPRAYIPNG